MSREYEDVTATIDAAFPGPPPVDDADGIYAAWLTVPGAVRFRRPIKFTVPQRQKQT